MGPSPGSKRTFKHAADGCQKSDGNYRSNRCGAIHATQIYCAASGSPLVELARIRTFRSLQGDEGFIVPQPLGETKIVSLVLSRKLRAWARSIIHRHRHI